MTQKNKKFKFTKVVIILLALIITIPLFTFYHFYNKLNTTSTKVENAYKSKYETVDGVTNILLLGTDGREKELAFRSDCMMIATIDAKNKNIKLTSLARDTYVNIPGKGKGKLNAAYFWGKEKLLFQTIEENFQIKLDKFIQVDFDNLMNIIFLIGGVDIDIKEYEIKSINEMIPGSYKQCTYSSKGNMELITHSGKQRINGYQAIAYTRIRKVDSAIYRDERQREVMLSVINTMKEEDFSKYPSLLNTLLPYVSTNLTPKDLIDIAFTAYNFKPLTIKQGEFPIIDDVHVKGGKYKNAGWVWLYDLNSRKVLQDFINNDIDMDKNEYLKDNSNIQLNY
ncbi:LCP family protein [Terrisporobacter mayombei]|uniref:Polyisoprenyl-teichoic acid--peptidoglycan teichoic acid transferase TagU n=1 Tax=Terrisporobacter mayombei TaxID=1541 RepID=A0ABY9Q638_9FIRM|nr:LCP family protein [Terrisporobacter mayombei]MCC3869597.1 LCP family protein [Terrisporobacter mayombei]WMT83465.1 Polyisoprenyl-teichoic acid--peptidoglycan teichoic acid transferase TagU [Terrisporobacter mayombei]